METHLFLVSNGVWQLPTWVDVTPQDVNDTVADFLTREMGSKNSSHLVVLGVSAYTTRRVIFMTYIFVLGERQHVQSRRVSNDNRIGASSGDSLHHSSAVPVELEGSSIISFARPSVKENEADIRRSANNQYLLPVFIGLLL